MKKSILKLSIVLLVSIVSLPSLAQKVGGGLAFGSEVESLGIGLNAEFPTANANIIISPSFILFFPDSPLNFWELNANMNYVFSRSTATVYGIVGLNLAKTGTDDQTIQGITIAGQSSTDLGLNIGVGSNFDVGGQWTPFAEMKYAISNADQLVIFAGVRYPIR